MLYNQHRQPVLLLLILLSEVRMVELSETIREWSEIVRFSVLGRPKSYTHAEGGDNMKGVMSHIGPLC